MTERTVSELTVLALLARLEARAISGYDLKKAADGSIGYLWAPSKTQLYVVLRRLVVDALVTASEVRQSRRPDKQEYRITAEGRRVVVDWLEQDEDESEPDRSTFVLKFFFGAQAAPTAMRRQLELFRYAYAERLALYEGIERAESDLPARDDYTYLTLRYGIERARAAVRWSEEAARVLEARLPVPSAGAPS